MWTSLSVRASTIPLSTHYAVVVLTSPSPRGRRVLAILTWNLRSCWRNQSSSSLALLTRSPNARVSNLLTWFLSLGSFHHGLSQIGLSLIDYSSRPNYRSHVRPLRRHLLFFSAPCC